MISVTSSLCSDCSSELCVRESKLSSFQYISFIDIFCQTAAQLLLLLCVCVQRLFGGSTAAANKFFSSFCGNYTIDDIRISLILRKIGHFQSLINGFTLQYRSTQKLHGDKLCSILIIQMISYQHLLCYHNYMEKN